MKNSVCGYLKCASHSYSRGQYTPYYSLFLAVKNGVVIAVVAFSFYNIKSCLRARRSPATSRRSSTTSVLLLPKKQNTSNHHKPHFNEKDEKGLTFPQCLFQNCRVRQFVSHCLARWCRLTEAKITHGMVSTCKQTHGFGYDYCGNRTPADTVGITYIAPPAH